MDLATNVNLISGGMSFIGCLFELIIIGVVRSVLESVRNNIMSNGFTYLLMVVLMTAICIVLTRL